jgi:hypothetical protein
MYPLPGPPDARSKLRRALGIGGLALCVLVALGVAALFLTLIGATKTGGADSPEKHGPAQDLANQAGGPEPWAEAIGAIVSRRAACGAVNRRPTSRRSDIAHSPVTASSSGCSTTSLADRPETVIPAVSPVSPK